MKVTVIGTGYVGLVTGTCLAEMGNTVTCVDIDPRKIDMLNHGELPIYEPGLDELVHRNADSGRLKFTLELSDSIPESDVAFIAVGTPPDEDGSADRRYVLEAASSIAKLVTRTTSWLPSSLLSQSGPATAYKTSLMMFLKTVTSSHFKVTVVSNPEFLKKARQSKTLCAPTALLLVPMTKHLLLRCIAFINPLFEMDILSFK